MAVYRRSFYPHASYGNSFGDQKPRAFAQKAKRKRERDGAKRRGSLKRAHVYRRLYCCGAGLSLWMARSAKGCCFVAAAVFLFSYLLYAEVLRENAYLSRTIEVQKNQKVVDTGLYGIVRHPMYAATILLFLSMPLVLGSLFSFIIFLIYPAIIVKRIKNEEEVLERELEGYSEYKNRVKYRLFPCLVIFRQLKIILN